MRLNLIEIPIPPGEECAHCHQPTKSLLHPRGHTELRKGDIYCMWCGAQKQLVEDGFRLTGLRLGQRDLVRFRRRLL